MSRKDAPEQVGVGIGVQPPSYAMNSFYEILGGFLGSSNKTCIARKLLAKGRQGFLDCLLIIGHFCGMFFLQCGNYLCPSDILAGFVRYYNEVVSGIRNLNLQGQGEQDNPYHCHVYCDPVGL